MRDRSEVPGSRLAEAIFKYSARFREAACLASSRAGRWL